MSKHIKDIEEMLDFLKLHTMGRILKAIIRSDDYSLYDPVQLFREVISEEYTVQC